MTKACEIPADVKRKAWERDGGRCIICGSHNAAPNAHYIPRSAGGLGIEENIFTACWQCHQLYDNSPMRKRLKEEIADYFRSKYPGWDEIEKHYRKGF